MNAKREKTKQQPARLRWYYKIEEGNLKRLRECCPKCGAGVYLAQHKNRKACGCCGYTVWH